MLTIKNGETAVSVEPGQTIDFGRAPGPLQLAANESRVSRVHGSIEATPTGWVVTSRGTFSGFTIFDCETPSRLYIPLKAGPIEVPFAWAIVAVEVVGDRYCLEVTGHGAQGWESSWGSVLHPQHGSLGVLTQPLWENRKVTGADNKVLRWFQTLVAMCEPRLQTPPIERVPTDIEIAKRLQISPKTLEKYRDRIRRELGFAKYDEQTRLAVVVLALGQGLVTPNDLVYLNLPAEEDPEDA
jgi:hypothetical protein